MALAVKRTAAAGGTDPVQTTAQGVWNQLTATLTAAGWSTFFDYDAAVSVWTASTPYVVGQVVSNLGNRYRCRQSGTSAASVGPNSINLLVNDNTVVWEWISSNPANDRMFFSAGESGTEAIWLRIQWMTWFNGSFTGEYVNYYIYQFATSNGFGYNGLAPSANNNIAYGQFQVFNGNTVNYAITANLDSFAMTTGDINNGRRNTMAAGVARRMKPQVQFVASNAVAAGSNATFNVTAGNPISAGYLVGDRIYVQAQQGTALPLTSAYLTIPIYMATVTAVTSSSITVNVAQEATSAGARFGSDPQPLFYTNSQIDVNLTGQTNVFGVPYSAQLSDTGLVNLYATQGSNGVLCSGFGLMTGPTANAAELDPNTRTNRYGMGEIAIQKADEIWGIVPKIWQQPAANNIWSIGRTIKEAVPADYISFPIIVPSTGRRHAIGPFPVTGTADYNSEFWKYNTDIWVDADAYLELITPGTEHSSPRYRDYVTSPEPYTATLVFAGTPDLILSAVVYRIDEQNVDRAQNILDSLGHLGASLFPFDSAGGVTSSGGGSGFNSGFN